MYRYLGTLPYPTYLLKVDTFVGEKVMSFFLFSGRTVKKAHHIIFVFIIIIVFESKLPHFFPFPSHWNETHKVPGDTLTNKKRPIEKFNVSSIILVCVDPQSILRGDHNQFSAFAISRFSTYHTKRNSHNNSSTIVFFGISSKN